MSDPTLSDIDFKNKMTLARTTLKGYRIYGKVKMENGSILSVVQFKCKITIFIDSVHKKCPRS